jgi:hypothetical protein
MARTDSSRSLEAAGNEGLHPFPSLDPVVELEHLGLEKGEDVIAISVEGQLEYALGSLAERLRRRGSGPAALA